MCMFVSVAGSTNLKYESESMNVATGATDIQACMQSEKSTAI